MRFKKALKAMLLTSFAFFTALSLGFVVSKTDNVKAMGGAISGRGATYELKNISVVGNYVDIKGFFYMYSDGKGSATDNYYSNNHSYKLYMGGKTYYDKNDYYVDHTSLEWIQGYSSPSGRPNTSKTYNHYYEDVGFHFQVPISDLLAHPDGTKFYVDVNLVINGKSYTANMFYLNDAENVTTSDYKLTFNQSPDVVEFYPEAEYIYVVKSPYKNDVANRWKSSKYPGTATFGKYLYYTPYDKFRRSNGSYTGAKAETSGGKSGYTTWYKVKSNESGRNKYDRLAVKANGKGSITSWMSGTFSEANLKPISFTLQRLKYTYSFDANGGWGAPGNATKTVGKNFVFPWTTPQRTGHTFLGWDAVVNGKWYGRYQPGQEVKGLPDKNITWYAQWQVNTHVFDLNGNLDSSNTINMNGFGSADIYINGTLVANDVTDWYQSYNYGSSYTVTDIKAKPGYTYKGQQSYTGTITGDTSIYPPFTTNWYSITYKGNGGKWNGTDTWSTSVKFNTDYVTEKNFYSRPHYTFMGWNESSNGSGTDWTSWIGKPWKWTRASNVTLYAQWKNYAPEITTPVIPPNGGNGGNNYPSNIPPFIDNEYIIVQKGDPFNPLDFATAHDKEDGDLTDRIKVDKDPIPRDENGNTNTSGNYVVDISVTDLGGATSKGQIKVIVNDPPKLTAQDRWFYVGNTVGVPQIMEKVKATDKEDGDIKNKVVIKSIKDINGTELAKDRIDTSRKAKFIVTYEVTDKYKKTVSCQATFNVTTVPVNVPQSKYDIRYVSKEFLGTVEGQWANGDLFNRLKSSLIKEPTDGNALYVFEFDSAKCEEMKNYIVSQPQDKNLNRNIMSRFSSIFSKRPSDGGTRKY